jgi:hypothetical protein
MKDIVLSYESKPSASTVNDPAWLEVAKQIVVAIVSSVVKGFTEAATQAGKELFSMFTVERLTAALTNYAREQAGAWASKAILDAGHQEWLATALHAFGLDVEDLLTVSRNALDKGFAVLTTELSSAWRKSGESAISSNIAMQGTIQDLGRMQAESLGEWTLYEAMNYKAEEEKNRMLTSAIFTETEEKISGKAKLTYAEQVATLREKADQELDAHIPGVIKSLGAHLKPVQDWMNEIALTARDSILYLLVPRVPVDYEHVGAAAAGALATAMGMGFAAHGVATAVDLLHPIKRTGVGTLAAFLADMAGFAAIARETWYEDLKNFLGTPYHHYSLRYFRPTLPDAMTLQMMAVKPDILMDDFRRGMEYWGFSNSWIDAIQRTMYKEPRYFELSMLMEDASASPAWLYKKFRRQGYTGEDSEIAVGGMMSKVLRPYLAEYRYALTNLRTEGYISEDQFDNLLEPLMLRSEARALLIKAARFRYVKDFTNDSVSMFTEMFSKDLIDGDDFRISLSALGIEETKRELIINRQIVKRQGKVAAIEKTEVKKEIRKQQQIIQDIYINYYRTGSINENELYSALVFAGISAEIATLTVELEKQKKITVETKKAVYTYESEQEKIRKKYETAYISLFRDDVIDADILYSYLKALGYEDDYVSAIVETEEYKKIKPAKVDI